MVETRKKVVADEKGHTSAVVYILLLGNKNQKESIMRRCPITQKTMNEHSNYSKEQKRMCHTHQDAFIHRRRMCDGHFPIFYGKYLWNVLGIYVFVLGLKTKGTPCVKMGTDKGHLIPKSRLASRRFFQKTNGRI